MDVPISLGVLLASGMSLVETMTGGAHAYFDSAITLLFFLLVGRYLDGRARGKARAAAERLLALDAQSVTILRPDGSRAVLPPEQVSVGMIALVAPGERVSVDGTVISGDSQVDTALITGESLPRPVAAEDRVFAGTMNLVGALRIRVEAVGETTLLAEIVRLMELAEQRRARYVSLADRLSRVYAPVVHLLALGAFLAWWLVVGIAWQPALLIAVAVLIITCPCALGLAVPAVQVIASGRLMRRGILLKSATALERLAKIDTVVFDKTGTLTLGRPELDAAEVPPDALVVAAGLAASSRHPLSQALLRAAPGATPLEGVAEVPGKGLALSTESGEIRLGSRSWCGIAESESEAGAELWLTRPNAQPVRFAFDDPARGDARQVIETLRGSGLRLELISGDRAASVAALAEAVGISEWRATASPAEKVARLEALAAEGRRVLMVGDGLNDAPALAAASVSLSPSTAVDIAQTAADAVFQGDKLRPVVEILKVAKRSEALVRQNFALALGYNAIAIPLALLGMVTPLLAAVAMSSSSLAVIGNSLRLSRGRREGSA
jgi:Cu2+-exporting ATPase